MEHVWAGQVAEDSKSKRQQILNAAYDVFSRKGYYRATVDEIIALADTGKGTVYNYFTNKEQLFCTLIQERGDPFQRAMEKVAASNLPALNKIEAIIKLTLGFYGENADLWRVLMHEVRGFGCGTNQANLSPETLEKYQHGFASLIGIFEKVLAEGVDQEILRPINLSKVAYSLFSVCVMMVYQNLVDDDIDVTARNIASVFLYGIARY
ncbi:MAG: transcriptional regulator, TetR family [Firmicutes bacterium]|nr:transcriptional regulator, TetR family [Bacillota bacterium]